MEQRKWHWIDTAMLGLYMLWIVSGVVYMAISPNFIMHNTAGSLIEFMMCSALPLWFWRPGSIHPSKFIASEIILSGGINLSMHLSMPFYLDNMVLPSLLIGFMTTRANIWWGAPIVGLFPFIGIWSGKLTWLQALDASVNHFILFGIGVGFSVFLHSQRKMKQLLQENEDQINVIRQYTEQVERLTVQEERNRVAGELHDTLGHSHVSIVMGMESVKTLMAVDLEQAKLRLELVIEHARSSYEKVRHHIHDIASSEEEQYSLEEVLGQLLDTLHNQTDIECKFIAEGSAYCIPYAHRMAIERCVQEAATNAVRHGKASIIEVRLVYDTEEVCLFIRDNGIGDENLTFGYGLSSMNERLQAYGGQLKVRSSLGGGIEVICKVPRIMPLEEERPIRLLIVDDEQLIRESLCFLFEQEEDIHVVGTARDGKEAIEYAEHEHSDIVLMDIRMPRMDGLAAVRVIKERWPAMKVILLTTIEETDYAVQAIDAGAEAYLLKSVHPEELLASVRLVHHGGTSLSQSVTRMLSDQLKHIEHDEQEDRKLQAPESNTQHTFLVQDPFGLTEREKQVLQYLAQGMKYREIAQTLYLAEGTIRNHISNLYAKIGVNDRLSAVNAARKVQLLYSPPTAAK
ncbi:MULTISPECIES: helix-turn-helix transcriptional regulator [unclassified Paenibacillus]|uniref:helix-turn-helix transcriptional regulator n=1 Tax=unclassified Paenibacillus TaxID=185978 RepID=UPI0025A0B90B|nr:hybrid sensor histidine kinase/response regulator transcription factor [Paenibacillus sp. S-12]